MRENDYNIQELVGSVDSEQKDIYYYHERSAIDTVSKMLVGKKERQNNEK
jgi:hypothetical protein